MVSLSSFIGVDGTNTTLNSGRVLINLMAKDQRTGLGHDRPRLNAAMRYQGISCFCTGAGSDRRIHRRIARNISFSPADRRPPTLDVGCRAAGPASHCPQCENVSTNYLDQGLPCVYRCDRDTAARFGITSATIDNALYDAFGQRIISTIFTQSNQYRVILEAEPHLQASVESLHYDVSSARPAADRFRCAHCQVRAARARLNRSPCAIPRGDDLVRCGAGLFAGRAVDAIVRPNRMSASRAGPYHASRARRWPSSSRWATNCC